MTSATPQPEASATPKRRPGLLRLSISTPLGWTACALALLALFGLFHLLGWRDDTAIISGTLSTNHPDATIARGLLYGLSYFAATIASPILFIAAAIHALMTRLGIAPR